MWSFWVSHNALWHKYKNCSIKYEIENKWKKQSNTNLPFNDLGVVIPKRKKMIAFIIRESSSIDIETYINVDLSGIMIYFYWLFPISFSQFSPCIYIFLIYFVISYRFSGLLTWINDMNVRLGQLREPSVQLQREKTNGKENTPGPPTPLKAR